MPPGFKLTHYRLPTVSGFTDTFLMATGFLILCFGAGLLVPRTLGSASRGGGPAVVPGAAEA